MSVQTITNEGAFDSTIRQQINTNFAQVGGIATGNYIYLNPLSGSDANSGLTPALACGTLAGAYGKLRDGQNDVLVLIGNGLSTGTARLYANFTWSKNAAHMVGVCAPGLVGRRARIAPALGLTAFANLFTVSGSGCYFSNLQWFHGFTTGTTAQICMTVSGGRNCFSGCDIQGMGDNESAQDTGSRSLLLTGTGENTFINCNIGLDTILRTVANYTVEFLGSGTAIPRNIFRSCMFPQWSSSNQAAALYVLAGAGAGIDRYQIIDNCIFFNDPKAGSYLASTGVIRLGAAQNGLFLVKDSACVGFTGWGYDATSRTGQLIVGGAPAGNTTISETGIAVAPTA